MARRRWSAPGATGNGGRFGAGWPVARAGDEDHRRSRQDGAGARRPGCRAARGRRGAMSGPPGREASADDHLDLGDALRAIRGGEADALVVHGLDGEQALMIQGADEPYRVVVETMSEGALVVDARDRVVYANPAMKALVGLAGDHVVGTRFDRLFAAGQA